MIQLNKVSKTYFQGNASFQALTNINLEVAKGEILGVIGYSGAGKSTLIRTVNLLERPDEGSVWVNGKDLTQLSKSALAQERKKIGMIFQHFNLLSSRTVAENIALPLKLEKWSKTAIEERVKELLVTVGLEDKADVYPKHLSGGQKQRVAIARALANNPYLLLCDEATSALDPVTTAAILDLLQKINQDLGITIVLITHEMHVIKSICQEVALIDKGALVLKTSLHQFITDKTNPIIHQFTKTQTMKIPSSIQDKLRIEPEKGLFPLVQVELNGKLSLDKILADTFSVPIPFKLIAADVEYLGSANFGTLLLHLQGSETEYAKVLTYFKTNSIKTTIMGYA